MLGCLNFTPVSQGEASPLGATVGTASSLACSRYVCFQLFLAAVRMAGSDNPSNPRFVSSSS